MLKATSPAFVKKMAEVLEQREKRRHSIAQSEKEILITVLFYAQLDSELKYDYVQLTNYFWFFDTTCGPVSK